METIQKEKDKRKRRFLWIFFPLLALVTVGVFGWYTVKTLDGVEERLDKVESHQEQALSSLSQSQSVSASKASEKAGEVSRKTTGTEETAATSLNKLTSGFSKGKNDLVGKNSNVSLTGGNVNETSDKGLQSNDKNVSNIIKASAPNLTKLSGLSSAAHNTAKLELLSNPPLTALHEPNIDLPGSVEIPQLSKGSQAGNWSLGVYGNLNRASLVMSGIPDDKQNMLTDYDHQYGGYGIGLQSFYQTSGRWSFGLEAGYNCFHNESALKEPMAYDKDKETTDAQGLTIYEAALKIGTPLGDYDYAANFRVAGNIQDEARLMNKTAIAQTLHTVHVASLARYRLIEKERWNWYVGAGLGADIIFKREHQLKTELYHGSEMMFDNDMTVNHLDNENSVFYSVVGETGFEYFILNNYSLFLQGQYNTSITNLRRQNNGGSAATYLRDFNVGIGLRMRL